MRVVSVDSLICMAQSAKKLEPNDRNLAARSFAFQMIGYLEVACGKEVSHEFAKALGFNDPAKGDKS